MQGFKPSKNMVYNTLKIEVMGFQMFSGYIYMWQGPFGIM